VARESQGVALYTLGCKLNQLESESIADAFKKTGFSIILWNDIPWNDTPGNKTPNLEDFSRGIGIFIINTCTVTSHSEQKARRVIRKVLRDFPLSCLIVTGCYAQLDAEALEKLEDGIPAGPGGKRLFVIPGGRKDGILDLPLFLAETRKNRLAGGEGETPGETPGLAHEELRSLIRAWASGAKAQADGIPDSGEKARADGSFRFSPADFSFHSRAFLKIEDGCDNRCAYCRVSIARGKSRSLGAAEVLAAFRELEARDFGEAVLTGVNLNQYKSASMDLAGLLEYLVEGTKRIRLRLSSIEPGVFSPRFVRALSHERIRPHFHLSLQSGSDVVLKRMGRLYSSQEALEGIEQLRSARGDPFLACDIIAGFPGETSAEFEKTYDFCRRVGFAWIHAFPFSPRPGTAAWHFTERVSERDAGERVGRLASLARNSRKEYVKRWLGKEIEVIVEADHGKIPGFIAGTADNYLKLLIPLKGEKPPEPGSIVRCKLRQAGENLDACRFDAAGDLLII
jgi:threonylcarbamoyladenosine tRNA methylthiotransferase MtaB